MSCDVCCSTDSTLEDLIQDLSVDVTLYNDHMDAVRSVLVSPFTPHRVTHLNNLVLLHGKLV